ncbi:MAG: hypothetical protein KGM24_12860 [Elusimicrobia bacterium]|nr:hypothetical protein [Elusimicrobiota bacterium]
MIPRIPLAVVLLLPAAAFAQGPSLETAYAAASARAAVRPVPFARPAAPPRARRYVPNPGRVLPENCANLPVVSIKDGDIYANGSRLGRDESSYTANCDGTVAWQDTDGGLYLGTGQVASSASRYELSWYGSHLAWQDSGGDLYLDGTQLDSSVSDWTFVKYTGQVVWKDGYGTLHRDGETLGDASSFAVAARTGDVAWQDAYGKLYRNHDELGDASTWRIADRTGDVGWLDAYGDLYKNGTKVASGVSSFTLREDGRLIWTDSSGDTHSA